MPLTAKGTYRDPCTRSCFEPCAACSRCNKRGSSVCPFPNSCSGRPDREGMREPHPDDLCQCTQGVMRWVTKEGKVIVRKYLRSPFVTEVKTDAVTADEQDWNHYIDEQRELRNDEFWDPVQFTDGTSTTDYYRRNNRGV
jgi:hypothetical protein